VLPLPLAHFLAPPFAAIAIAILAPLGAGKLFAWVYGDDARADFRRAMRAVELASLAIGIFLAATAFAPWLDLAVRIAASVATGLIAWLAVLGAGAIARRAELPAAQRPSPLSAAAARVRCALSETAQLFAPPRVSIATRGGLLAPAIAIAIAAPIPLARGAADLEPTAIQDASEARALAALDVAPSDAEAMLALAWHARRAGDLELASLRASAAERMGADAEALHVARAEIAAAAGDCDTARAELDASFEAQAARQLGSDAELVLGSYSLPPTLVRECELSVGELGSH
jgi:hypothetical protein